MSSHSLAAMRVNECMHATALSKKRCCDEDQRTDEKADSLVYRATSTKSKYHKVPSSILTPLEFSLMKRENHTLGILQNRASRIKLLHWWFPRLLISNPIRTLPSMHWLLTSVLKSQGRITFSKEAVTDCFVIYNLTAPLIVRPNIRITYF